MYRSWSFCNLDLSITIDSIPFPLTRDILVDVSRVYLDVFTEYTLFSIKKILLNL